MRFVASPLLGALMLILAMHGVRGRERRFIQLGFLAHVVGTLGIVAYHWYVAGGDMLGYAFYGRQLARLIDSDVTQYLPEVVKLTLHLEHALPAVVNYEASGGEYLVGTTTTTMYGLTGLVMFVVGDNLVATSFVYSAFAYGGTAFLYKKMRSAFEEHERIPVMVALMLMPSVVFWSSGIVKEAVLLGFFGLMCGALYDVTRGVKVLSIFALVIGVIGTALVKPYVFFPLTLAIGAWLNARRRKRLNWATRIAAVLVAVMLLAALSQLFPQFGVDRLADTVAGQQTAGAYSSNAGSYVEIGAPEERTLMGQIRFVPLALLNALARPFIFEAKNPSMLLASLETTVAAILFFSVVYRRGFRVAYRSIVERPPFAAAVVFTLSFGAAVGLATTNLGTLSRYRLPMIPMYMMVLLALRARRSKPATARARTDTKRPLTLAQRRIAELRAAAQRRRPHAVATNRTA